MGGMKDNFFGDRPADVRVYPLAPGFKEDTTSKAAAKHAAKTFDTVKDKVLREIEARASTADEVAAVLALTVLTVRPAVTSLFKTNKIEPVPGVTRPNESGRDAKVWRLKVVTP